MSKPFGASGRQDPRFRHKLKLRKRIGSTFQSLTFFSVVLGLLALGALLFNVITNGRLMEAMHSFVQTQQVTLALRAFNRGEVVTYTRVAKDDLWENTAAPTLKTGDVIVAFEGAPISRSGDLWEKMLSASNEALQAAELRYVPRAERLFGDLRSQRTDAGRIVTVEQILPGSPAEAASIRDGDIIRAVDGVEVTGTGHVFEQILLNKLRNPNFDPVEITIDRQDQTLVVSLNVVRSTVDRYERNMLAAVWYFATNFDSRYPEIAGMMSAISGSVLIILLTAAFALPLGVAAAIYLEEYAPKNAITNFINVNIANLAGVPSVVYGIIGLELFARAQVFNEVTGWFNSLTGLEIPKIEGLGRSVLAGSLTLALLILPVIIINAREALKAVPFTMREAAYGVGASPWQVVRHHVMPYAMPGVFTGVILAMSRAIGETAPLILLGAFLYVPFNPTGLFSVFTVMPIQIFSWTNQPQDGYPNLAAMAILVLLGIMLLLNAAAIFLRNRFQMRW